MYIRLSDTDRKALGLDEELIYFENGRFTNREARLLERMEPDGPGLSPEDWFEALRGEPVEVNGVPVIDDETGEPERMPSAAAFDVLVWLALRRNGRDIAWSEFEYDRRGLSFHRSLEQVESGKDEPVTEDPVTTS